MSGYQGYVGAFANYWQAFVPHPFWFGYHFVSVYYHLKEHYVNFFRFFQGFLNYFIHPSNYWVFKNAYFQSFFVTVMDLKKKKCQTVFPCEKVLAFWKEYFFSDRNTRKYSKSKIEFKYVCLRVFRHFDSQFDIFFEKLRLFYFRHVIFRLGFARVHNDLL